MNTTDHLSLASSYYNAILAKDFDKMASYLHDHVYFIGPLAEKCMAKRPLFENYHSHDR